MIGLACIGWPHYAWAQDQVYLNDGTILQVSVQEVHPDRIKYLPYNEPFGTEANVPIQQVVRIVYANGYEEWYTHPTPDEILFHSGALKRGKVLEIGIETVVYVDSLGNNQRVNKADLDRIRFENGYEEVFIPNASLPEMVEEPAPRTNSEPADAPATIPLEGKEEPTFVSPLPEVPSSARLILVLHAGAHATTAIGPGMDTLGQWQSIQQGRDLPHNTFSTHVQPDMASYAALYNLQIGTQAGIRVKGPHQILVGAQAVRTRWQALKTEHYRDPEYQFDAYWDTAQVFTSTLIEAMGGYQYQGAWISVRLAATGSYGLSRTAEAIYRYREVVNGTSIPEHAQEKTQDLIGAQMPRLFPGAMAGLSIGKRIQLQAELHWRLASVTGPLAFSTLRLQAGFAYRFSR
ncbi:MAG: hypothetical protein D6722_21445 [Bacteroidetes bacterium]|nr:MAG: hypothetical protein D6722_21445 [Bacteroidota bacterium]